MATPSGVVSGTKVILQISGAALEGEVSHSVTDTVEGIDITNKSDADVRTFLESEGRRLLDLTIEALDSAGVKFRALYTAFDTKAFISVARTVGTRTVTSDYMVTSISDSPGLNTAVVTSFTLASTGTIVVT